MKPLGKLRKAQEERRARLTVIDGEVVLDVGPDFAVADYDREFALEEGLDREIAEVDDEGDDEGEETEQRMDALLERARRLQQEYEGDHPLTVADAAEADEAERGEATAERLLSLKRGET